MNHKSRGLKVLSLALLAVAGLMAFMAAGAQASWLVEAKEITANQLVTVKPHNPTTLLVPTETQLAISCATTEAKDLLLITGTTTATGEIWFSSCTVAQGGSLKSVCDPKGAEGLQEPIKASGNAKLILHEGKNYVLFEPKTAGGNFAQVKFAPPCALPETNNVKGTFVAECLKASNLEKVDCKQEEKVHLLQQASEALFTGDKLLYGTKAALLDGVASAQLSTEKTWAGHV